MATYKNIYHLRPQGTNGWALFMRGKSTPIVTSQTKRDAESQSGQTIRKTAVKSLLYVHGANGRVLSARKYN